MEKINDLISLRLRSIELALQYSYDKVPFELAKNIESYVKEDIDIASIKDETDKFIDIMKELYKNSSNNNIDLSKFPRIGLDVKIKKLSEDAVIPTYAKPGDAGLDLTAISYDYKEDIDCHVYGTGLAIEIPEGYVGLIFPRSSNRKTEGYMCNHVGVIDSGYRGEIMVSFKNRDAASIGVIPQCIKPYEIDNKIAQLIVLPYPAIKFIEVTELSSTERGEKGHGSTGK